MTRWLVRLYPRRWRDRYGDEFLALLEDDPPDAGALADIAWHALGARVHAHRGGLRWLAAVVSAVAVEWFSVSYGFTDNVLWLPRSLQSGLLLSAATAALGLSLLPPVRWLVVAGIRHRHR